jgi:dUTP pyrophosphatase
MNIKLLTPTAKVPTRGSDFAAGYDLYADETVVIPAGETCLVHTGIIVELHNEVWAGIYARSGLASKQGLRPANCVGIIDPDYRGEWMVAIHNDSNQVRIITLGERIAQFALHYNIHPVDDWTVVDELTETERGDGGFGSTGLN